MGGTDKKLTPFPLAQRDTDPQLSQIIDTETKENRIVTESTWRKVKTYISSTGFPQLFHKRNLAFQMTY